MKFTVRTLMLLLFSVLCTGSAYAYVVETTSRAALANYQNYAETPPTIQVYDPRTYPGPAAFETISARVEARTDQLIDPSVTPSPGSPPYPGYSSAALGPAGHTTARVAGHMTGSVFATQVLVAETIETAVFSIPTLGLYHVNFSFHLYDMFFEFRDNFGLSASEKIGGRMNYHIQLYQGDVPIASRTFGAQAQASSHPDGLAANTDLFFDSLFNNWEFYGTSDPNFLGIRFDPVIVTDLHLGTVFVASSVDETFSIKTYMTAQLSFPESVLDVGGQVGISDPSGLAVAPTTRINVDAVPVPTSLVLFFTGVVSLAGWLRKK